MVAVLIPAASVTPPVAANPLIKHNYGREK